MGADWKPHYQCNRQFPGSGGFWRAPLLSLYCVRAIRGSDSAKPEPKLSGDVNENGVLDLGDAVLLQRYLLVDAELTQTQAERADVLEDQVLNGLDLTLLKQLLFQKV